MNKIFFIHRYGGKLKELGFSQNRFGYWRLYGDNNFQMISFQKPKHDLHMEICVTLLPLYGMVFDEKDWCFPYFDIRKYYQHSSLYQESVCGIELEDLLMELSIGFLQEADTAERAYEISVKLWGVHGEQELDENTGLYWPECVTQPMAYYAVRCGMYEKMQEYLEFEYAYSLSTVTQNMIAGVYDSEQTYQKKLNDCYFGVAGDIEISQMLKNEKRQDIEQKFQRRIEENIKFLENPGQVVKKKESVFYKSEMRLKEAGFIKKNNVYQRFFGEEVQVIVLADEQEMFMATYPLYCSYFLHEILSRKGDSFADEIGMWNVSECYYDVYFKAADEEKLVDFAIACLQSADTPEHAYNLWCRFQHSEHYTKVWNQQVKCFLPECVASPMFYNAVRCRKYDKVREFVDYFTVNVKLIQEAWERDQVLLESDKECDASWLTYMQKQKEEYMLLLEWTEQGKEIEIARKLQENLEHNKMQVKKKRC